MRITIDKYLSKIKQKQTNQTNKTKQKLENKQNNQTNKQSTNVASITYYT